MDNRHAIFAVFSAALIAQEASAQVTQIPGNLEAKLSGYCQSVHSERNNLGSLGDYRIKRGGHVTVTGVRQTVYVEEGGSADIRGTASLVYVAKGGKVTVSGERNIVYSEKGGNVVTVGKVTMNVVDAIQPQPHASGTTCQ